MFARVLVMVLAVNRDLLLPLLPPFAAMGAGGAGGRLAPVSAKR